MFPLPSLKRLLPPDARRAYGERRRPQVNHQRGRRLCRKAIHPRLQSGRKTVRLCFPVVAVMRRRKRFEVESGLIRVDTAQFFTGATEQRSDTIFCNARCHTDFVIAPALKMIEAYDISFGPL